MLIKQQLRGESLSKSNEEVPEGCLSDADLAAFQEGSVKGKEQKRIVAHLVRCARCRSILGDSIESEDSVPEPPDTKNSPR